MVEHGKPRAFRVRFKLVVEGEEEGLLGRRFQAMHVCVHVCSRACNRQGEGGRLLLQFSVECDNRALERKHNFVCFCQKESGFCMFLSKRERPTGGKKWTWTRPFARPRPSSTSDEGGSAVPNSRLITAVIWISRTPMGDYGASRLYTNNHDRHCDATKDKATEKPNARRVGNGMEGASRVMGTLARNSFHHE